jgi:hypothetical protein
MNIKNVVRYSVAAVLGFLTVIVPAALANTTNLSFDPSYATGPFVFYCEPYVDTFTAGGLYTPIGGSCAFSIPATITGSGKVIALYKGIPGNSGNTVLAVDAYFGSATLVQEDFVPFGSPTQGDDYFAAVIDLNQYAGLNTYFQSGGSLPAGAVENQNFYVMRWNWGITDANPPLINITSPVDGNTYLNTDSVIPFATITDLSPIATSSYRFNTIVVDRTLSLPLSGAPLGLATLSVSATDIFGNSASVTSTFTIAAPVPSDTLPPVVTIISPQHGHTYLKTDTVNIEVTIVDPENSAIVASTTKLNGVSVNPALPLPLSTMSLGTSTLEVTATDSFGHVGYAISTFIVKSVYTFSGFYQPINDTGHAITSNTSVFKAGSTIPVKFQLLSVGGSPVQIPGGIAWVVPVKGPPLSATPNETVYTDQPSSGNTYSWSTDHYQYNWKTASSQSGYWYYLFVILNDGSVYYTILGLR